MTSLRHLKFNLKISNKRAEKVHFSFCSVGKFSCKVDQTRSEVKSWGLPWACCLPAGRVLVSAAGGGLAPSVLQEGLGALLRLNAPQMVEVVSWPLPAGGLQAPGSSDPPSLDPTSEDEKKDLFGFSHSECACVCPCVCVCALGWCHSFQPSLRLYLNMNRRNPSVLVYSQIKQACFNPVLVLSFWIKLVVFCDSLFLFSSFCFVQIWHIYPIKEIILHLWKIRTPWGLFLFGGWQRH